MKFRNQARSGSTARMEEMKLKAKLSVASQIPMHSSSQPSSPLHHNRQPNRNNHSWGKTQRKCNCMHTGRPSKQAQGLKHQSSQPTHRSNHAADSQPVVSLPYREPFPPSTIVRATQLHPEHGCPRLTPLLDNAMPYPALAVPCALLCLAHSPVLQPNPINPLSNPIAPCTPL
ncbi:hypothetical protein VTI74DRAFT_11569 [Chaetomium olivicolor]